MISTFEFSENIVGVLIKTDLDVSSIEEVHEVILERLKDQFICGNRSWSSFYSKGISQGSCF